jgi:hypothetical protein
MNMDLPHHDTVLKYKIVFRNIYYNKDYVMFFRDTTMTDEDAMKYGYFLSIVYKKEVLFAKYIPEEQWEIYGIKMSVLED